MFQNQKRIFELIKLLEIVTLFKIKLYYSMYTYIFLNIHPHFIQQIK